LNTGAYPLRGDIIPRETGLTSDGSFLARELVHSCSIVVQMTAEIATAPTESINAGAHEHPVTGWHAIAWPKVHTEVRRLQVRIAKATREGRWGKVKAL
jgi:RNA-directed DNA polymerase